METPVYMLSSLCCGHLIQGPAIIIDRNSTILVEPSCSAKILRSGDIQIEVRKGNVALFLNDFSRNTRSVTSFSLLLSYYLVTLMKVF